MKKGTGRKTGGRKKTTPGEKERHGRGGGEKEEHWKKIDQGLIKTLSFENLNM